jgi:hypothetical protein
MIERIAQVTRSVTRWIGQGAPVTPAELLAKRQAICEKCPAKKGANCDICGCFLSAKQSMATESCPWEKW